jgi:hypothetical protein
MTDAVAPESKQDGEHQGEENQNDLPTTSGYLCDHRLLHTTLGS